MNHELLTIATAASPFLEADAAIPLGMSFGFTPLQSYILATIGNTLPIIPLLWFWGRGVAVLSGWSPQLAILFGRVFAWTRSRHGERMAGAGLATLTLLLALPIPFLGAWTATVLAYLFGFPFWKSFYAIVLGVALGGVVTLVIAQGAAKVW